MVFDRLKKRCFSVRSRFAMVPYLCVLALAAGVIAGSRGYATMWVRSRRHDLLITDAEHTLSVPGPDRPDGRMRAARPAATPAPPAVIATEPESPPEDHKARPPPHAKPTHKARPPKRHDVGVQSTSSHGNPRGVSADASSADATKDDLSAWARWGSLESPAGSWRNSSVARNASSYPGGYSACPFYYAQPDCGRRKDWRSIWFGVTDTPGGSVAVPRLSLKLLHGAVAGHAGGSTILFVGDSHMRYQFISLACVVVDSIVGYASKQGKKVVRGNALPPPKLLRSKVMDLCLRLRGGTALCYAPVSTTIRDALERYVRNGPPS